MLRPLMTWALFIIRGFGPGVYAAHRWTWVERQALPALYELRYDVRGDAST